MNVLLKTPQESDSPKINYDDLVLEDLSYNPEFDSANVRREFRHLLESETLVLDSLFKPLDQSIVLPNDIYEFSKRLADIHVALESGCDLSVDVSWLRPPRVGAKSGTRQNLGPVRVSEVIKVFLQQTPGRLSRLDIRADHVDFVELVGFAKSQNINLGIHLTDSILKNISIMGGIGQSHVVDGEIDQVILFQDWQNVLRDFLKSGARLSFFGNPSELQSRFPSGQKSRSYQGHIDLEWDFYSYWNGMEWDVRQWREDSKTVLRIAESAWKVRSALSQIHSPISVAIVPKNLFKLLKKLDPSDQKDRRKQVLQALSSSFVDKLKSCAEGLTKDRGSFFQSRDFTRTTDSGSPSKTTLSPGELRDNPPAGDLCRYTNLLGTPLDVLNLEPKNFSELQMGFEEAGFWKDSLSGYSKHILQASMFESCELEVIFDLARRYKIECLDFVSGPARESN